MRQVEIGRKYSLCQLYPRKLLTFRRAEDPQVLQGFRPDGRLNTIERQPPVPFSSHEATSET